MCRTWTRQARGWVVNGSLCTGGGGAGRTQAQAEGERGTEGREAQVPSSKAHAEVVGLRPNGANVHLVPGKLR